ncbi:MAG: LysM peptidoglycan-binding domain-containing protein [Chloroflexi bacterium]|nr:LysM peptidoglycan-binding domain-containing protein [Chloroflexota bacterium]
MQRNALSVAAVSVLVAVLGLGFGVAQFIARPEHAPALLAVPPEQATLSAATTAGLGVQDTVTAPLPAQEGPRAIQANATVLQPNYTVQSGDTLGRIATQFNTTVDRIQALNNLPDPRVLHVGTKLIIPPPL